MWGQWLDGQPPVVHCFIVTENWNTQLFHSWKLDNMLHTLSEMTYRIGRQILTSSEVNFKTVEVLYRIGRQILTSCSHWSVVLIKFLSGISLLMIRKLFQNKIHTTQRKENMSSNFCWSFPSLPDSSSQYSKSVDAHWILQMTNSCAFGVIW